MFRRPRDPMSGRRAEHRRVAATSAAGRVTWISQTFPRRAAVMAAAIFMLPAAAALTAPAPAAADPALGVSYPAPQLEAQANWRGTCPPSWKPLQVGPPFVPAPAAGLMCSNYGAQLSETDGALRVVVWKSVSRSVFVPQLQGPYWSLPEGAGQWAATIRATGSPRFIELDLPVRSQDGQDERRLRMSLDATAAPVKLPSGYARDMWAWGPCPIPELAELWPDGCPTAPSQPSEAGGFFFLYTGSRSYWPAEAVGSLDGESFGPASITEVRTATGTLMCGGKGELFEIVCLTPENWGFGEMPTEP
jgi:hypothetical protein